MSDLIQKTLAQISTKHIQPLPRWYDQAKNGAYWLGAFVLVLLAVFATTVILHALFEIDWDAYSKAHFTWSEILLSGVPLFVLLSLFVLLMGGIVFLHLTRRGYRYSLFMLFGLFFLVSSTLGYFIEALPLDKQVDRFLLQPVLQAERWRPGLLPSATRQWSQPEKGLLGGTVETVSGETLQLRDATDEIWTVDTKASSFTSDVRLAPNEDVKIIGAETAARTFRADEIRGWKERRPERGERER